MKYLNKRQTDVSKLLVSLCNGLSFGKPRISSKTFLKELPDPVLGSHFS